MELYERYKNSKSSNIDEKINVITEIITTYPKVVDYLYNRMDTCFGEHTVYLVHMRVNGQDMLKMGYTKNSVEGRFAEKRYAGRNTIEIIEIIRQNKLQAKGAVEFEKHLKEICKDFRIQTDLTLPGKDEFMNINFKDEILQHFDNNYPSFVQVVGLKSPN